MFAFRVVAVARHAAASARTSRVFAGATDVVVVRSVSERRLYSNRRYKSSSTVVVVEPDNPEDFEYALNKEGDVCKTSKERARAQEVLSFPSSQEQEGQPVLLNAKEHVIGYLSRILNARVYEAAIETDLQYATNLSAVSGD
jgi:hypothetical protein